MQKIKLAICIGEPEYLSRITNCLLTYYRSQFELYIFSNVDCLLEKESAYDVILLGDYEEQIQEIVQKKTEPIVYLVEDEIPQLSLAKTGQLHYLDKYSDANQIVEEILKCVGEEVKNICESGGVSTKTQFAAVYSLAENELQLPYVVTMASILGEEGKVLVVDLQENSGLSHVVREESRYGLEEMMVMAESGQYTANRLRACISHHDTVDYLHPLDNAECICEADYSTYYRILDILRKEMDYTWIILNLGSRFVGFFQCLQLCNKIYLVGKKSGLCQWREYEFMEEMQRKGFEKLAERVTRVELPIMATPVSSCERLVEQWKWNELGDLIRGVHYREACVG